MLIKVCGPADYFRRHFLDGEKSSLLDKLLLSVNDCLLPIRQLIGSKRASLDPKKKQIRIINYDLVEEWRAWGSNDLISAFKSACLSAGWADAVIEVECVSDRDTPHLLIILTYK